MTYEQGFGLYAGGVITGIQFISEDELKPKVGQEFTFRNKQYVVEKYSKNGNGFWYKPLEKGIHSQYMNFWFYYKNC